MTDDIVTRLRDDHCTMVFNNHEHWCKALGLMEDAADEIERLRAEVCRLTLLANLWEAEFNAAVNALITDRNPT